jgi:hypothetical protein
MAGQMFRKLYGHFFKCLKKRWPLPATSPSREQEQIFIVGKGRPCQEGSLKRHGLLHTLPSTAVPKVSCQFIPHRPGDYRLQDEGLQIQGQKR